MVAAAGSAVIATISVMVVLAGFMSGLLHSHALLKYHLLVVAVTGVTGQGVTLKAPGVDFVEVAPN